MVSTSTKYIVYTHTGTGVRHHHYSDNTNVLIDETGSASNGDIINAFGIDTMQFNGQDVKFAFMSVHGAADGNHLYTSPGNQQVHVGSSNVDILVVYAPPGGIGVNGGPGIWVDAFNVDTGNFSDSLDFIKVLTPPTPPDTVDAAKTTFGNQDGGVSTVTAENVRANDHVDGAPFVEWKKITPTASITNNRELHLTQGETGEIWFAFYQTPPPPNVSLPNLRQFMTAGIFLWTGDDTCGNGGHWVFPHGGGPGPGPGFKINVSKEVIARLTPENQKKLAALSKDYPAVAQAGLTNMTKTLEMIQTLNAILATAKR